MSWVAASGWDTNETCEAGTSTIVAFPRSAMNRWSAGGIALSSVPSRYQHGTVFHPGEPDGVPANAAAAYGRSRLTLGFDAIAQLLARTSGERRRGRRRMWQMGDERLRSEIREEQERIISAVRSAEDHWKMAKAEDSFADLLERMADELEVGSAHDRGRFLAAAQELRKSAAVNEQRYITALSRSSDDT
jgi:hypothetical protein